MSHATAIHRRPIMWIRQVCLIALILSGAQSSFALDNFYSSWDAWYRNEGFCYNHDEYSAPAAYLSVGKDVSRRPVPDLACWLFSASSTSRIVNALIWQSNGASSDGKGIPLSIRDWNSEMFKDLEWEFANAWNWYEGGGLTFDDPDNYGISYYSNNLVARSGSTSAQTILDTNSAYNLYVASVAYTLAAEMGHWYQWNLRSYNAKTLTELLDSRHMFFYFTNWAYESSSLKFIAGYKIVAEYDEQARVIGAPNHGAVVPIHPSYVLNFIGRLRMGRANASDQTYAVLNWGRDHLSHFNSYPSMRPDGTTTRMVWGQQGWPSLKKVLDGTISSQPEDAGTGLRNWTMGCHGTAGWAKSMLRVLNLPTEVLTTSTLLHSQLYFPVIGRYLSHGDDLYSRLFRDDPNVVYSSRTPLRGTDLLMLTSADYSNAFPAGNTAARNKVGIGVLEASLRSDFIPTNYVMYSYCNDLSRTASHANGEVYTTIYKSAGYTVAALESRGLWTRLENRRRATSGGCTSFNKQ